MRGDSMKIMLKLVCMLMTVILCACTSVDKKNTVDDSKYNLDADYSIVHSNFASIKQMEMTKDYILLFPKALERGKTGEGVIISYLDNDKMEILEANPSSSCSLHNPDACSGFIQGNFYTVYKDKLYYFMSEYEESSDDLVEYIMRCNFDDTNREKIFKLPSFSNGEMNSGSFVLFEFHRNKYIL